MIKNYIKTSTRNLIKHKYFTSINILGLAVGISCFLLILFYVRHELSYDRYHENAGQLYRVAFAGSFGGSELNFASVAAATAKAIVTDYPEVLAATRIYTQNTQRHRIRHNEKTFIETNVAFADPNLFDVFTIPLSAGNPSTALAQLNTIIISDRVAAKYFGNKDPLGKILTIDAITDYQITGVFREIPSNTHFHYDFFASLNSLEESRDTRWLNNMAFRTYVVLSEDANPEALEAKFSRMVKKYCAPTLEESSNQTFAEMSQSGISLRYYLQPVTAIHLNSDLSHELEPNSDIKYIYIFSAIALFILVISCTNFMNLSSACSVKRSKEVGIRKVVGSHRFQLIAQFLTESVTLSIIAFFTAIFLVMLTFPYFNNIIGKELSLNQFSNGKMGLLLFAIAIIIGLLAGSYPAFLLSSYKPVTVLKQKFSSGQKSRWMRSILVIFQFIISTSLIIGTSIVYKQLNYIQNKKLGFSKDQILILHDASTLESKIEPFKNELLRNPDIVSATVTGYLPGNSHRTTDVVSPEGIHRESGAVVQRWAVDFDYIKTMGMEIVKGRDFSRDFPTDSKTMIVNEAAVEFFGWDDPIGKSIHKNEVDYRVIGVVRNYHYESLREHISPLVLFLELSPDLISLRLKTENLSTTIRWIESRWNVIAPGQPFSYSFLDDRFNAMYRGEQMIRNILGSFAALAIFIGCLGLFGLAAFTAEQKTREIGIRKVLGASVTGIIFLLSKEYIKWVILALLIASPLSYFAMKSWLQDFAYRTSISWWIFLMGGAISLAISLLTVSLQVIKSALINPVDLLKFE